MGYVKGCDITDLTKGKLRKIENGKLEIIDDLKDVLSYEVLSDMFAEAKVDYVNSDGKTIKDCPNSEILMLIKKIDKKKYILGLTVIKRIAGEPSDKKGLAKFFENSNDTLLEVKHFFADGFEKEKEYFDESVISHLKSSVGHGSALKADYQDKIITRAESKTIFGITISRTVFFIAMVIIWGLIFKNFAIGLCLALCFMGSFALITEKSLTKENGKSDNEEKAVE